MKLDKEEVEKRLKDTKYPLTHDLCTDNLAMRGIIASLVSYLGENMVKECDACDHYGGHFCNHYREMCIGGWGCYMTDQKHCHDKDWKPAWENKEFETLMKKAREALK